MHYFPSSAKFSSSYLGSELFLIHHRSKNVFTEFYEHIRTTTNDIFIVAITDKERKNNKKKHASNYNYSS